MLVSITKLSEELEMPVSRIRQWKKNHVIVPHRPDERDMKRHLYHPECARVRRDVYLQIGLYFSQKEIGKIFENVFGKKDERLKKALESSRGIEDIIEKYASEIEKEFGEEKN